MSLSRGSAGGIALQVLQTAGTIAAGAYGGPWAAAAASVGHAAFWALVDPGETPDAEQPKIQDLAIMTVAYGVGIPRVYGKQRFTGNVIHSTEKVPHIHEEEAGGGSGGFGGAGQVSTSVTYSISLAVGICEGPIAGIARIWADDTLVYDKTNPDGRILITSQSAASKDHETGDGVMQFVLYYGSETQDPDPYWESIVGAGLLPAYRGLAYLVMQDLDLGISARVPNFTFEVYMFNGALRAMYLFPMRRGAFNYGA